MWRHLLFVTCWAVADAKEAQGQQALLQLPGWNLGNLEQTQVLDDPADEASGRSSKGLQHLDRRQVRLVMLLIFAGLVAACGGFVYLSIRGSECFADIDLSNQMSYRTQGLVSWMTLLCFEKTITTVMTVFVSLLLGFFITNSVARWTSCVESFLGLFEAIRALQMQLHALGVSIVKIDRPVRYGLVSAWLLDRTLREDRREGLPDRIWDQLIELKDPLLHDLKKMADPAIQIWVWVASFLGSLAQEGEIPPMASPIYGRLLQIVKSAQDSMKQIRAVREVQVPYVYTHTLAAVVHVSNMLCATSMGLTLGSCLGSILAHIDSRLTLYGARGSEHQQVTWSHRCLGCLTKARGEAKSQVVDALDVASLTPQASPRTGTKSPRSALRRAATSGGVMMPEAEAESEPELRRWGKSPEFQRGFEGSDRNASRAAWDSGRRGESPERSDAWAGYSEGGATSSSDRGRAALWLLVVLRRFENPGFPRVARAVSPPVHRSDGAPAPRFTANINGTSTGAGVQARIARSSSAPRGFVPSSWSPNKGAGRISGRSRQDGAGVAGPMRPRGPSEERKRMSVPYSEKKWIRRDGTESSSSVTRAMGISSETLALQNSVTSAAIIEEFKEDAAFKKLAERLMAEIMRRDQEDGDKLAKGIQLAVDKKVLPADVKVEPTTKISVSGKSADKVADEIVASLGCVMTLQGLSGTGKGTTVEKLKEKLPNAQTWSNGNLFRSLTLLAVTSAEQKGCELKDVLTAEESLSR
eukprot:g29879.t1